MADADAVHTAEPTYPNAEEFDESSLAIPPLDTMFLSSQNENPNMTDLGFNFEENYDFDFTFDDLDDLYFPSESEPFLLPNNSSTQSPESGSSGISGGDQAGTGGVDVAAFLNCPSVERSGSATSDQGNSDCDLEFSGGVPVSSHGSGNCGSGVSEATNYPNSPDSSSENFVVEQKVKFEEIGKVSCVSKRKKESEDVNGDLRTSKYRKSENANMDVNVNVNLEKEINEEDEKRKARLIRNRESAQLSRQRKKHYVEELEEKVRSMHSTIAELNGKISYFMAENATLRQQLSGGNGMCPTPTGPQAPMMYPPPMGYPWVPCSPYMVKPQGSQVPLVPIPRLKPQQPVSTSKAKKSESKKSEGKTKKVASISFLGLLFFMLLFGGLVPIVNVKFGVRDEVTGGLGVVDNGFYDQHRGRVLRVDGFSNGSDESTDSKFTNGKFDIGINCGRGRGHNAASEVGIERKELKSKHPSGSDEFVRLSNASEPLTASLYVPRNDKLVKIDGNLIIHSVLASEKAMASQRAPESKNNIETGLAIPRDLYPALAIPEVSNNRGKHSHMYRNPSERPKALSSGASDTLKDHMKSSAADGKMQQWFREGLAGPMLSSGMCTEVFHFDVSSGSAGAIIPASSVSNTSGHRENSTQPNKGRRKRILRGLPVPVPGSNVNFTGEHMGGTSHGGNFQGNASASSMVVSVLVDPREAGDSDIDGVITPKSLSRIFVVVLIDSVKYVTYSCMLPRSGTHLVTT